MIKLEKYRLCVSCLEIMLGETIWSYFARMVGQEGAATPGWFGYDSLQGE